MNWHSPFSVSAFAPRVSSTTLDSSASTDSSPEQLKLGGASGSSCDSDVPLSRTHTYKKITKPLLERKRRARINKCLDELKDIMTVALQAEGENVSKLEKADILELTVRHLHKMAQGRRLFARSPLEDLQKFQAGYTSCANEAASFLLSAPEVDVRLSQRLLNHLSSHASSALASSFPPLSLSLPTRSSSTSSPPASPPHTSHLVRGVASSSPPHSHSINPSSSSPQLTQASLTLSIRRQTPPPPLTERNSLNSLSSSSHTSSEKSRPIKPEAIRLHAVPGGRGEGEGVWRPYTAN